MQMPHVAVQIVQNFVRVARGIKISKVFIIGQ
jgi:hypothetical protein